MTGLTRFLSHIPGPRLNITCQAAFLSVYVSLFTMYLSACLSLCFSVRLSVSTVLLSVSLSVCPSIITFVDPTPWSVIVIIMISCPIDRSFYDLHVYVTYII